MQTIKFDKHESKEANEKEWLDARRGRITGTRLKDLILKKTTKPKQGFYEIIAERVAVPANDENVMDRGHRLETDALARFAAETGKEVDGNLLMWLRDDNNDIAISPDGVIGETEAVEVKCLSSARHIEAYLTREVPSDYREQVLQYFIVNDKLKSLYFVFFDPRMPKDFFYLTFNRTDVWEEVKVKDEVKLYTIQDKVDEYLELERQTLERIEEIVAQLTF
jgi:predicted phage-related endonuclease